MNIQQLRQARTLAVAAAKELLNSAEAENRSLNAEETTSWDAAMAEADELRAKIDQKERMEDAERSLEASQGRATGTTRGTGAAQADDSLRNWLLAGVPDSNVTESRNMVLTLENRAQSSATGAAGGYTVQQETMRELEQALLASGGVRQVADVIRTASGADLPWPTSDNTDAEVAEILGQNDPASDGDLEFGQRTLKAHKYVTKIIKVPVELIQDSAINLPQYVGSRLGEQLGRGTNRHFTTGTGVNQPEGVATGAVLGVTAAAPGAVTYEELVDMIHSVDPAYRRNFTWMFHDETLRELRKLRDNDGALIWQESLRVGEPDRILGKPYTINMDLQPMGAGNRSIVGGDFSKYKVRDVRDVTVVRLDERFAEFLQVAFLAYSRHDGLLLDAGTNPVKYLTHSA
jgi:HK97 family phage major capsid protein